MKNRLLCIVISLLYANIELAEQEKPDQLHETENRHTEEMPVSQVLFFLSAAPQQQNPFLYGFFSHENARITAKKIHDRLDKTIKKEEDANPNKEIDYKKIGESLDSKHDAQLVYACTKAELSLREKKNAGTISIVDPVILYKPGQQGISTSVPADVFYKQSCSCALYKTLTDDQLRQLYNGLRSYPIIFLPPFLFPCI